MDECKTKIRIHISILIKTNIYIYHKIVQKLLLHKEKKNILLHI